MASMPGKLGRNNNFEDEYKRTLEAKYAIKIFDKQDGKVDVEGDQSPLSKLRSSKCETENTTPKRSSGNMENGLIRPSPGKHHSLSPPNGHIQSPKTNPKEPRRSIKRVSIEKADPHSNPRTKVIRKRKRGASLDGSADVKPMRDRKRVKLNCTDSPSVAGNGSRMTEPTNGIHSDVRKKAYTITKPMSPEVKSANFENYLSSFDPVCGYTGLDYTSVGGLGIAPRSNNCRAPVAHNLSILEQPEGSHIVNQNLNKIGGFFKSENCQKLYEKKLLNADNESSPFKGKMSAFEISLLKGRQNLERRKSLESATLRSSPRANKQAAIGKKSNYSVPVRNNKARSDNKPGRRDRVRARLSLDSVLEIAPKTRGDKKTDQQFTRLRTRVAQTAKKTRVRRRAATVDPAKQTRRSSGRVTSNKRAGLLSDSGVNERLKNDIKRKSRRSNGNPNTAGTTRHYRLNGSNKRNSLTLPARLTLSSVSSASGTSQSRQGKAAATASSPTKTTLCQRYCANSISGTPPVLHSKSIDQSESSPTFFVQPTRRPGRPVSLPLKDRERPPVNHSPNKGAKVDDPASLRSRRLTLEETIQMLRRQNSLNKSRDHNSNRVAVSPSRSESRGSRRSSRSSTPNMATDTSPIKTDILTPRSTPASSPDKSPCGSPSSAPRKHAPVSGATYLFAKNDEVLTRWHDGRFYVGTILKIDDVNKKCQLRYEDHSQYWSMFKDIHRVLKEDEMVCCVCLGEHSQSPNEIVLCEYCMQGYHQECHSPDIGAAKIVNPNEPWFCRQCVFLRTVQVGGAVKEGKWAEELRKVKMALPYPLEMLTWDAQHKNNAEQCYCYCGGPGIWFQKMLQCCRCKQWFHEACIQCMEYPVMFADSFYIFVCSPCNTGSEYIQRLHVDWADILHICLFNLAVEYKRKYFDIKTEILPWIHENWQQLQLKQYDETTEEEREDHIEKALKDNRFASGTEMRKRVDMYGLRIRVPPPRIHVTLPSNEKICDELMLKLKIRGRRSKVFTPVECNSPVKQLQHSPTSSTGAKKRLNLLLKESPVSAVPQKPRKPLTLLDKCMPADSLFQQHNHPFLLATERSRLQTSLTDQSRIWTRCEAMNGTVFDKQEDSGDRGLGERTSGEPSRYVPGSASIEDEPPILVKIEPLDTMSVSSGTSSPPMPEIQRKQQQPLPVASTSSSSAYCNGNDFVGGEGVAGDVTNGSANKSSESGRRKKQGRRSSRAASRSRRQGSNPADNDPNGVTDGKSEPQMCVKRLKAWRNYFCAYDKTGFGAGFHVMGKCYDLDGDIVYMIKWDQ